MLNKTAVLFDQNTVDFVLDVLDKTTDSQGFIVEKGSMERVITPEGIEIRKSELGLVVKGSQKFIMSDLDSLMKFAKGQY